VIRVQLNVMCAAAAALTSNHIFDRFARDEMPLLSLVRVVVATTLYYTSIQ